MKTPILSIMFVTLIVGSFISGIFYQNQKEQNQIEDIVSKEVSMLMKYEGYPTCNDVKFNQNQYKTKEINDALIVWKYLPESRILKKVIISNSLNVVSEELKVKDLGTDKCKIINI